MRVSPRRVAITPTLARAASRAASELQGRCWDCRSCCETKPVGASFSLRSRLARASRAWASALRQGAARRIELVGEVGGAYHREQLSLLDAVSAIDEDRVQVTDGLCPHVGLLDGLEVHRRADLDRTSRTVTRAVVTAGGGRWRTGGAARWQARPAARAKRRAVREGFTVSFLAVGASAGARSGGRGGGKGRSAARYGGRAGARGKGGLAGPPPAGLPGGRRAS